MQKSVEKAMQSDIRTDAEKARDRNRNPIRILDFFGLEEDMKVVEIIPAGGWYTKILGPVLRDKGELYLAQPDRYYGRTNDMLKLAGLDRVKKLSWGEENPEIRGMPGIWDMKDADMVLTFRNYHNFSAEARAGLNKSSYAALKPGGLYGVIDHTRRHMESDTSENGRRVDPVLAIKEIQAAGFELVDYSNLLFKADDELRYEVGRKSVSGNTDRFALLFRKPEK